WARAWNPGPHAHLPHAAQTAEKGLSPAILAAGRTATAVSADETGSRRPLLKRGTPPRHAQRQLHRSGRTTRAPADGQARRAPVAATSGPTTPATTSPAS